MEHRGVVITAGFDKSESAICIAELLSRKGIPVTGIIVVSPYSWKRLKETVKKSGLSFIWKSLPRLFGYGRKFSNNPADTFAKFREQNSIDSRSLKKWARKNNTDLLSVYSVNSGNTLSFLREKNPQWLIYSGGGIIKDAIIHQMDNRILNAHQGPLPQTRGMNAAEWSVLLDENQEVTIHLIDRGIDTGDIIKRVPFTIKPEDTIESMRDKAVIKGIEGLVEVASEVNLNRYRLEKNHSKYRQCYRLSRTMDALLREKLMFQQSMTSDDQ